MKHYYYQFETYDHKRKRWIKKRGCGVFSNELVIGHEYVNVRYGTIRPTKLQAVYDNDNLIYRSL